MVLPFGQKEAVEIVIGEIKGWLEPSEAERAAAYELVVELATRTATAPLRSSDGTIREALTSIHQLFGITRRILRSHGVETDKGGGGNLSMAVLAVRVLNEVFRPMLSRWHPELSAYEARRDHEAPQLSPVDWERRWEQAPRCRADLLATRRSIRAYVETLSRIAGVPEIGDAVQAPPPSAMLADVIGDTDSAPTHPHGARPRKKMVRWMDAVEGIRTGLSAMRASQRLEPVAMPTGSEATAVYDAVAGEEFWFDYVADMGDGFDGTAPVAWLLGRNEIALPNDPWGELPAAPARLPRGRLLVLGGDEIYPYAFEGGYEDQLELPYLLGLQRHEERGNVRDGGEVEDAAVIAIPGNHDWLGGLKHFDAFFTRGRTFADHWETPQTAPYWHVQLPQGWWLWGIDTGLHNDLPDEQVRYFTEAADLLAEGDRVIMCTPVPLWQLRQKYPEKYRALRGVFDRLLANAGCTAPLWLSGDSHYFAHFERADMDVDEDHITAGGGGAFLQPTHNLPERIPLERGTTEFKMTSRWPRPADSRSIAPGASRVLRERQFLGIAAVFGGLVAAVDGLSRIWWDNDDLWVGWEQAVTNLVGSPAIVLLALLTLAGMASLKSNSLEPKLSEGAKRYGMLVGLGIAVTSGLVVATHRFVEHEFFVDQRSDGSSSAGGWFLWPVAIIVGGYAMLTAFMSLAKWANGKIKAGDTVAFSSAYSTRYKHFLRFRIDLDGNLTCYAVGIDPVGEGWYDALTTGGLVPPWDSAGIPRIHYVWGKSYEKFRPQPMRIAISVSDPDNADITWSPELLTDLSTSLISSGHTLLYGGLPGKGYTRKMWDAEREVHANNPNADNHMINYVAAYLEETIPPEKPAGSVRRIVVRRTPQPGESDILGPIDDLTAMRRRMTGDSDVRIIIGGNLRPGKPGTRVGPGVIEEAYLAVTAGVPLIVAGGFGGAAGLVADALLDRADPATVDQLSAHFSTDAARPDRPGLEGMLDVLTSPALLRNGLTFDENKELLVTADAGTALKLIHRSIRRLGGHASI